MAVPTIFSRPPTRSGVQAGAAGGRSLAAASFAAGSAASPVTRSAAAAVSPAAPVPGGLPGPGRSRYSATALVDASAPRRWAARARSIHTLAYASQPAA